MTSGIRFQSMEPAIITVAITGAIPTKQDNPAVPVAPAEQVESAHEAFEAGATVCHIHVRDRDQRPSSDPERFAAVQAGLHRHCPGMIVQFSTGGRGRTHEERALPLQLRPEMASLATGSVNFPKQVYDNPPDVVDTYAKTMLELGIKPEIEVFDLAMLYAAAGLLEREQIRMPVHAQLVLGIKNALPAREALVDFFVSELADVLPGATWTCAGIGRAQLDANRWSLARGGHVRTGLEDNLYYDRGRLARSNAELVARVADLCAEYDRRPATLEEARELLGIRAPAPAGEAG
jgi:3-keto-5-aminohexanoate cleavage enzyme